MDKLLQAIVNNITCLSKIKGTFYHLPQKDPKASSIHAERSRQLKFG